MVLRSLWIDLRHVSFGRPLFLVPWGVQSRACFVISPLFLRRVWPIHLHVFLLITVPISSWLVLFKSSVLDIVSGQYIFSIFLRHLLIKVCSCLMMALVVFQVSLPYRSTDFTLVLKMRILVLVVIFFDFQILFRLLYAWLALLILCFTSFLYMLDWEVLFIPTNWC